MSDLMDLLRSRRTIRRFESIPVAEEALQMILEAGRWAPSFSNLQPCKFIVVRDPGLKKAVNDAAKGSVLHWGIHEAPVVILVCIDPKIDALHATEAGAAATQNMTLMAHHLGLGSGWIGIMGTEAETVIRKQLNFQETLRIVSLVPIGKPKESPTGHRKPLEELVEIR